MEKNEVALSKYVAQNIESIEIDLRIQNAKGLKVIGAKDVVLTLKQLNDSDLYSFNGVANFTFQEPNSNRMELVCEFSGEATVKYEENFIFEIRGKVRIERK